MSAVKRLKAAGFEIRLIPPDTIGITPVEYLTDLQRQWVKADRTTILAELRSELAIDCNPRCRIADFIFECQKLGAAVNDVLSMFSKRDIADLCEEPSEKLSLHARTIVTAINRGASNGFFATSIHIDSSDIVQHRKCNKCPNLRASHSEQEDVSRKPNTTASEFTEKSNMKVILERTHD